ncbi:MAG TPA: hypothetical protein VMK12_02380 [Anaeromyxobacteraceae bacterium]|nr:hypothetical protein [Anaeromyxobacteraceae bacterium]
MRTGFPCQAHRCTRARSRRDESESALGPRQTAVALDGGLEHARQEGGREANAIVANADLCRRPCLQVTVPPSRPNWAAFWSRLPTICATRVASHTRSTRPSSGAPANGRVRLLQGQAVRGPRQPERQVTYWDCSLMPVKDPSGKVVVSLRETTKHKRAEPALCDAE